MLGAQQVQTLGDRAIGACSRMHLSCNKTPTLSLTHSLALAPRRYPLIAHVYIDFDQINCALLNYGEDAVPHVLCV